MPDNKGLLLIGGIGAVGLVVFLISRKGGGINQVSAPQIPLSGASVGDGGFPDLAGTGNQFIPPILGGSGGTYQSGIGTNPAFLNDAMINFTPPTAAQKAAWVPNIVPQYSMPPEPGSGGPY